MFKDKLEEYKTSFKSDEINDADSFEKKAVEFRNWFVQAANKTDVIKNFDKCAEYSFSIARHYRPKNQECGCDCLLILFREAAPIQIKTIGNLLREVIDKLIVISHNEVTASLMPLIHETLPVLYSSPCTPEFHDLFTHLLEFWARDGTKPESRYLISSELIYLIQFAGLASSRYILAIFSTISSKLRYETKISHILKGLDIIFALAQQTSIVSKINIKQYQEIINLTKTSSKNDPKVITKCESIMEIIQAAPDPPVF